jgi:hypothetical protein
MEIIAPQIQAYEKLLNYAMDETELRTRKEDRVKFTKSLHFLFKDFNKPNNI